MDNKSEELDEEKLWEDMDLANNAFDRQIMHEIARRKSKETSEPQAKFNVCYSSSSSEHDADDHEGILAEADRPFFSINEDN